ncbi:TIGR00269 family protein [archaeon]|nr:TIGR00269 family protein [archaeon]|tara:strand:+ start:59 stop:949 length:891 start_codon:yes stop_codon:yes gene_type:complete
MPCKKCSKKAICSDFCRSHFVNYIENKVRKTIRKYKLFTKKDKIAVAVSGGKDSTVLLFILHKLGYNVTGITVDAKIGNYTKVNLENLREVCNKHEISLKEINFRDEFGYSLCYIRDVLKSKGYSYSSCTICGVLRRYLLNKYSKDFDLIATGHNLDDEAQAFLMNIFRNDVTVAKRQGPISGVGKTDKFIRRVKPLFTVKEKEVETYSKLHKFPVNYNECPCCIGAYRKNFKKILDEFEKNHPDVKYNVINFFMNSLYTENKQSKVNIGTCKNCGEPSSNDKCKVCIILDNLNKE